MNEARHETAPFLDALASLLPQWVALHATHYNEHDASERFALPAEIKRAVARRRAEFIAGRVCAREALVAAGGDGSVTIPIGPMRAPVWPPEFVGSITHAGGMAIAAVSRVERTRSLGIDLEYVLGADDVARLAPTIAMTAELATAAGAGLDAAATLTAVFAAKEALFKALAPEVGRYFDFLDVAVIGAMPGRLTLGLAQSLTSELPAGQRFAAGIACVGRTVLAAVHRATSQLFT